MALDRKPATEHKFAVGDLVALLSHHSVANVRPGIYRITRAMPATDQGRQYRVKHTLDKHERVLDEAQLRSA